MSLVWLAATNIEPGYTFDAFSNYFGQSSDQRFGIPSNIYYMSLSSRWNYLFCAGRIWFEFAIRISGWARINCADSFSSNPWFAVRVVTKLASYIIPSVNGANLLLGVNVKFRIGDPYSRLACMRHKKYSFAHAFNHRPLSASKYLLHALCE